MEERGNSKNKIFKQNYESEQQINNFSFVANQKNVFKIKIHTMLKIKVKYVCTDIKRPMNFAFCKNVLY